MGKDELPAAVALSSVGVNLARAVGPAIAGVLVSLVGPWLTFALNALSFFAVIAVLLAWKREAVPSVLPAERLFGALRAGWRYSRSSRPLQSVLVRAVAFFLGASAGMSLLPLIVRGELHGSAMDFGLLLGSVGVGAVLGAAFLPRLRERLGSDRLVLLSSVLYALVLVALALLRNLYLLVPVMLLSGAAWIAVLSSLQVAAQTSVPAWVRARALAVYILVFFGSMAAGGTCGVWSPATCRSPSPCSAPAPRCCSACSRRCAAGCRSPRPRTSRRRCTGRHHWSTKRWTRNAAR